MRSRLWLVIALALVLFLPTRSYASEIDYLDSFGSGVQDTFSKKVETETEERKDVETVRLEATRDESSSLNQITDFFFYGMTFQVDASVYRPTLWYLGIARLLTSYSGAVLAAVTLVFLWWGVRKAIRVLFRAFRKGRIDA